MQHFDEKHEDLFKATGNVIRRLRLKTGLSVNIFAYENDLQKSMISRLENGKNEPKLASLWKIAEALGIKPSDFIKEVELELSKDFKLLKND